MDGFQGNSKRCPGSGYEALKLEGEINAAENRRKDEETVKYIIKNILKGYFDEQGKEAWQVMLPVYGEKEIMMEYIKSVRQDAAKENAKETAIQLLREGLSAEQIARCSSALSVGEVKLLQEELL